MESVSVHGSQVLSRQLDYTPIDVHEIDGPDGSVFQHFLRDSAITAPDNHHPLDPAVLEDSRVYQHLRIGVLVTLRDLDDAVQDQDPPEHRVFEQQDVLEPTPFVGQYARNLEGLCVAAVKGFRKFHHPVRASSERTPGKTWARARPIY